MSQRNGPPALPWTGISAMTLAAFGAGVVLAGPWELRGLLHPWYLSRATGLVAYVLLWAAVAAGLLQSTALLKGVSSPLANIDLHTFFSVGALHVSVFHAVILIWDKYVTFSPAAVLIPFAADFKPALVGLGSLAFYVSLAVTVTTFLRGKLSPRVWRAIHLSSLGGFTLALVHGLLLGTDSAHPAVGFLYRFTGLFVLVLTALRVYLGVIKGHANSAGGR